MLIIRPEQFQVMARAPRAAFEDELIGFVGRHYPRELAEVGREGMRAAVRLSLSRADRFGLETKRQVTTYVSMALLLGSAFDEDPQLPWARAALLDASHDGPDGDIGPRVSHAWRTTVAYVVETAGASNEHLVKALLRARDVTLEDAPRCDEGEQEAAISAVLRGLHPHKWAHQGDEATRAVIRDARDRAVDAGLPAEEGTFVLASLAFLLGAGVADDPLFPWVRAALDAPGADGAERVTSLHAAALAYLETALTDSHA